ncbi:TPA: small membrane protein [Raoultella ornithinolytica]|nr:small membrane protein [Raoultella ornithinolytica]
MNNFFFLAIAFVLLIISVVSFLSYIRDRRKQKFSFKNKKR